MKLNIKEPVIAKYLELCEEIRKYESDTFSASSSRIKRSEAKQIADILVVEAIQALIDTDTMDGCRLSEELENIRPDHDD